MKTVEERVQAGQRSALEEIYDTYAKSLYEYVLSLLWSRDDAEDTIQNVFVKLVSMTQGNGAKIGDMKSYLFRAARNEALTIRSRRQMGRDVERARRGGKVMEPAPDADPLEAARVEEALARLPVEQREVLVLKIYHGFTFQQIGDLVGEKLNTVASRFKYAVAKLKPWMQAR